MTNQTTELPASAPERNDETFFEALASYAAVLVVGLFIFTFLGQNFVIPSGSMEHTLRVGDHLFVDRVTTAPHTAWAPFVHYREPRRGDITVFIKPVMDQLPDGSSDYLILVKRLVAVPGDRIHLHNGILSVNGVAQPAPPDMQNSPTADADFLDEFPATAPSMDRGATESWSVEFPSHVQNGELVVPPGMYFMMGDNRHNSLDSRYWGFVPRENIVGRPVFNYWSFETPDGELEKTGLAHTIGWLGHVGLNFFTGTRWSRTFHVVR